MMRPVTSIAVAATAFGVAFFGIGMALGQTAAPAPPAAAASTARATSPAPQIERGRYLAALGDCIACHTPPGSAPFAGGRPVATPFGTVLSANLTPDTATGIGRYTPDTFYRALHEGLDHEGRHLYPAFPYTNYTHVTREDADAMYAYLRNLKPVTHAVDRNQLKFPFNIRGLMGAWNWMFFTPGQLRVNASKTAEWNRGAYLVEGLGHCQACHTPHNSMGGTKKGEAFRGGVFDTWFAPDITPNSRSGLGNWKREDVLAYLRAGENAHSAASGEMGEVVGFSTSQMTDADLSAVAVYLADLPASPIAEISAASQSQLQQGRAIWQDACAACHREDAVGVPRYFPPLKGNANLQQSDPTTVIHYILAGAQHRPTALAPTPLSMPPFAWKLSDAQVAAVATYARNSWGNSASPVTQQQVAALRPKVIAAAQSIKREATPHDLKRPGPLTLAPADTDSRDNGTLHAGAAAASVPAPVPVTVPASAAVPASGG